MPAVDLTGYEGPRPPRAEEWEAVLELSRSIFFPQAANYREAAVTWPMALLPEFSQNTFAIFHQGRPVSAIGRVERDIVVNGCALRMGYIGGVCTCPEHRGKGLAGAIQSASFRLFEEHGVDFVYISGTRPMYYGAGANHIGGFRQYTLAPGSLPALPPVTLRAGTLDDVALLSRLNAKDAVRFLRPPVDYEIILHHGHCAGRPSEFLIAEALGVPVASLFLTHAGDAGRHVLELRGDRQAVLAGLAQLAGEGASVGVNVPRGDALGEMLDALGVVGHPGRTSGTVKVLDFCRTMKKLRPLLAERLGTELAGSLRFLDAGTRYLALGADGALTIDGETNLLWMLLGGPGGEEPKGVEATGSLQALRELFPIPWPSVYLNMI